MLQNQTPLPGTKKLGSTLFYEHICLNFVAFIFFCSEK